MNHLLFCKNHPEKFAKRHCNKCDQDLCNECVFDSHIEHHSEINKIEYTIDTKSCNFAKLLSDDIKLIVDKSLNDLKPQIYKLVAEKTEQYIKDHKNLQLKLAQNQPKKTAPGSAVKRETKANIRANISAKKSKEIKEAPKNQPVSNTTKASISQRAKLFSNNKNNYREVGKKYDDNNPYKKGADKNKGVKDMAKIFDNSE